MIYMYIYLVGVHYRSQTCMLSITVWGTATTQIQRVSQHY